MLRLGLILGAAVALTLSQANPVSAQQGGTTQQFLDAMAVAQAAVPDGQLIRARAENKGRFGFYFWKNGRIYEIEIGRDNKIEKNVNSEDPKAVSEDVLKQIGQKKAAKTKLPEGRLIELAGEALKDKTVSEIKYIIDGDKLILQVGDLKLDATTGKPIK